MIDELSHSQKEQVIDETAKYISLANRLLQTNHPNIPVLFDLKGHTIGMYKHGRKEKVIRYNMPVFVKYFAENIRDTVPHEVAHYIVDMQYGAKKVRPHGVQWKLLMKQFGADGSRTAAYDLTGIPKRGYSTLPYRCDCRTHQLGIRRHNKVIARKTRYFCRHCGDVLTAV